MEDRKIITIEDDADDIIVDSPTEVYGSLSEAYASIRSNQDAIRDAFASIRSSQDNMRAALDTIKSSRSKLSEAYASIRVNQDAMRSVAQSMSKSLQKIYECTKPVITPDFNKAALASMTTGLCKIAEASKLAAANVDYTGTASAMAKLSQSIAKSTDIAETIRKSSTLAMTESVRKSIEASSRALSDSFAAKGLTVSADQLKGVVTANKTLAASIPKLPAIAVPSLQTSLADVLPKTASLISGATKGLAMFAGASLKIAEWIKTSPLVEAATSALTKIRDYWQDNITPLLEKIRSIKPWPFIKKHALRFLLYLRKRWLNRRRKPIPLDEESFRKILALQPIGPATSFEFIEFADLIRLTYLRKHQRISDDTDDLNDSFLLAC